MGGGGREREREPGDGKMQDVKCGSVQTPGMKAEHQRGFIVTVLSFTRPRASFMFPPLSFTVPFSLSFSSPLSVFVQRERGQAALLFLPAVATKCFIKPGTKYEWPLC